MDKTTRSNQLLEVRDSDGMRNVGQLDGGSERMRQMKMDGMERRRMVRDDIRWSGEMILIHHHDV
jgi:hypothetical protein